MAELDKQQPKTQEYYGNYPNFRVASGIKIPDGDLKGEYVLSLIHISEPTRL